MRESTVYLAAAHRVSGLVMMVRGGAVAAALGLGLVVFAASLAVAAEGPVVSVTGGQVQGRLLPAPGGAVFKGIPYAAPPVGDLRWRETQPVKPWTGVLQAADFRPGCGQADPAVATAARLLVEDCLYINVWTQQWPASTTKRPVIYWINGGELAGGSGTLRSGPESLARHGVILVSANYRGTLLGMMGHPELTAESPHHSSGNYVLLDQIAVLNWIHSNISRFGGDAGNVTVFGQSGGSHAISMLLTSPLAKGLIHRAILDSGAPMQAIRPYLRLDQLEQMGIVTAQLLNAPTTDAIRYLRGLPASEIVPVMPAVRTRLLQTTGQAYDEGIDGYAIPESPAEVWLAHREAPVPLMIGSNAQDTTATIAGEVVLDPKSPPEAVLAWEERLLRVFYDQDPDLLQRALQIYGLHGTPNEVSTYPPYGSPVQQLQIDLNHRCSAGLAAFLHTTVATTWQFEFTRSTTGHAPTHGAELRYILGSQELTDEKDQAYAQLMQQYWANFAKNGDPNGAGLPIWPKYDGAGRQSLEFTTDGPIPRQASRVAVCAPFSEKYTRHTKLLSNGDNLRVRGSGGAM